MCNYLNSPAKWVNWLTHFCEPVETVDWRHKAPSRAHDIFGEQRPQSVIVGHILCETKLCVKKDGDSI
jgi:hypothetical protein